MVDRVRIELLPLEKTIEVERGAALQDVLFDYGVEFPCGGHGRCRACRVRVLQGSLPVTRDQEDILSRHEIAEGWRLACRCHADADVTLDINQWESSILADDSSLEFQPSEGLGVAVDLGTTTLVAQLVDLSSGKVLAVQPALNPQAAYGADVMSRVQVALRPEGRAKMRVLILNGIGQLISGLRVGSGKLDFAIRSVIVVGNTVMHHLFSGIEVSPLAYYPFEPAEIGLQTFRCGDLGWQVPGDPVVRFLPCIGGFVGSDVLAGIVATRMHESEALVGLIDLGTNGEVVFGNRERLLCASTAAGPAFEGARIRMGMRAATGAISEVRFDKGGLHCHVIGGGSPRGICGSGLVDAVAVALELGDIQQSGRFRKGIGEFTLAPPVTICQSDIRELQLAKGAIAAAIRLLLIQWQARPEDVSRLFLAGAFGNYIDRASARRIGLIDFPQDIVSPAGNTALHGAKLALFDAQGTESKFAQVRERVQHVPLAEDPKFQDVYVESMPFP